MIFVIVGVRLILLIYIEVTTLFETSYKSWTDKIKLHALNSNKIENMDSRRFPFTRTEDSFSLHEARPGSDSNRSRVRWIPSSSPASTCTWRRFISASLRVEVVYLSELFVWPLRSSLTGTWIHASRTKSDTQPKRRETDAVIEKKEGEGRCRDS